MGHLSRQEANDIEVGGSFSVLYRQHYKQVVNHLGNLTYNLYQCGTPIFSDGVGAEIEIPPKKV